MQRLLFALLGLAVSAGCAWGQAGLPGGYGTGVPGVCLSFSPGLPGCGGAGTPASGGSGGPTFIGTAWNPLDKSASIALSNSNWTATSSVATDAGVRAVDRRGGADTGKYYFEVLWGGTVAGTDTAVGITLGTTNLGTVGTNGVNSAIAYAGTGTIFYNGVTTGIGGQTVTAGQYSRVALDKLNNAIYFSTTVGGVCGNWNNSGTANPSTNTGGISVASVFAAGAAYPVFLTNAATNIATLNSGGIGQPAFHCPVPAGFTAGWPVGPPPTLCVGAADLSTGCANLVAFGGLF